MDNEEPTQDVPSQDDEDNSVWELSERATYARETAYLANAMTSMRWCFDSGATTMSTGDLDIFECIDKQSVTAQSTTKAEYMAPSEAAKQAVWVRHFLYAIGKGSVYENAPTSTYGDNQRPRTILSLVSRRSRWPAEWPRCQRRTEPSTIQYNNILVW